MALGKNIRRLREERGWTQQELSDRTGGAVSQGAISVLEQRDSRSSRFTEALAIAFGVNPGLLIGGEKAEKPYAVMQPLQAYNTEPGPSIKGKCPLISWVRAGDFCAVHDPLQPGDAEEWLACPVTHSDSTFVLRVRGESMLNPHGRPSFSDGDLIFVDPERQPVHGSLVIVRLDDEKEATFKRLIIEGARKYLKPLNPSWPEQIIEISQDAMICGVVIFKGERI